MAAALAGFESNAKVQEILGAVLMFANIIVLHEREGLHDPYQAYELAFADIVSAACNGKTALTTG